MKHVLKDRSTCFTLLNKHFPKLLLLHPLPQETGSVLPVCKHGQVWGSKRKTVVWNGKLHIYLLIYHNLLGLGGILARKIITTSYEEESCFSLLFTAGSYVISLWKIHRRYMHFLCSQACHSLFLQFMMRTEKQIIIIKKKKAGISQEAIALSSSIESFKYAKMLTTAKKLSP